MRRLVLLGSFCALLLGAVVPATAVSCIGAGDVTALPSGCTLGSLTFDQFAFSAQGQGGFSAAVFLGGAPFTNVSPAAATLGFQVSHEPAPTEGLSDILLSYRVTTSSDQLRGINLANGGTGPVTIHERACKSAFTATGACLNGDLLGDLVVPANGFKEVVFATTVPQMFVLKDILIGDKAFISDFSNSHELQPVPEPATLLLLGSTFAGLGAWHRRRKKKGSPADLAQAA